MTRPSQRREPYGKCEHLPAGQGMAGKAVALRGVSIALACRTFGVSETCYRYSAKMNDENEQIADLLIVSAAAPDILDRATVRYERIPVFEDRLFERDLTAFPSLLGLYQIILDEHVPQVVRVLKLLGDVSDRPVLVHCTAGKDRTGLILALTHVIAGLSAQAILEDYGASEKILGLGFEERVKALYRQVSVPVGILGASPGHAPPAYLQHALETMHAVAGSVPAFLERSGLTAEE